MSCRLVGSIDATKVTGSFSVSFKDNTKAVKKFLKDNSEKYNNKYKVQLNHKIDKITFGDESNHGQIRQVFGETDHGDHTIFNMFHKDGKVNDSLKTYPEDIQ